MAQTEEQRILDIQVKYEDAINGIVEYKKRIDELKAAEKELAKQFKDGSITENEYRKGVAASKEAAKEYNDVVRTLSKEVQNNIKQQKEAEGSLKSLRAELSNATKAYDELSRAEREGAKGQAMQKHINDITDELKDAEEATQRFYRNVGNYEGAINNAIFGNSQFGQSLQGILDMANQGSVLDGLKTKFSAFGQTVISMVSNPYFLALAGVAGAGMAFKWFYDYNQGLAEASKLTQQFTGLTGDNMKYVRNEVQAVSDSFGLEFSETLQAANTMARSFGISIDEALKLMQDGLVAGANANGEFIDTVREYPAYFNEAGISAEQFVAITTNATKQGIFSDKGVDTIKEANLRLREMSTSTADALNGIGISSDEVQKALQDGSKTTFDVMQEVGNKLKELPQTSAEVGTAIADIFGGPGEDAGLAYIESLGEIELSMEAVKEQAGEVATATEQQLEAQKELSNVMSALFDMTGGGFETMKAQITTIATKALTSVLKAVINVINYFIDWYNESLLLRAGVQAIVTAFKNGWASIKLVFNLVIDAVKSIGRQFRALGDIVEGVFTLDWDKISGGFSDLMGNFGTTLKEIATDATDYGKEVANNWADAVQATMNDRAEHITIPSFGGEPATETGTGGSGSATGASGASGTGGNSDKNNSKGGKSQADITKAEQQELRKAEDLLNQLITQTMEQRRKLMEQQYDRQISDLRVRLETEKNLTVTQRQAITVQIQALEQIKAKKLAELDRTAKDEAIKRENEYITNMLAAVEKGSTVEYNFKVQKIQNEHQLALDALEKEVLTEEEKWNATIAINAKFAAQEEQAYKEYQNNLIQAQQDAINKRYEMQILQAEVDYYNGEGDGEDPEIAKLRLQMEQKQELLANAQQLEGETIEAFNQRKLQMESDYQQSKQALNEKEIAVEKAKYQAISGLISGVGDIAEAFGEDSKGLAKAAKVLALGEIAVNTGVAIAQGVKQAQSVPYPGNIVAIATTVATVLANIATAIKTVKSAKFAKGGDVVGEGTGTSDSISARLSNGESVLTAAATSMFAPALSAFNQMGGGVPIVGQGNNSQVGEEYLANAVARGMAMAPSPIVSVEEINRTSNRVEAIERLSTIG